jgi:hypothetical protein
MSAFSKGRFELPSVNHSEYSLIDYWHVYDRQNPVCGVRCNFDSRDACPPLRAIAHSGIQARNGMQQTLAGGSHWVSAFPGPQKGPFDKLRAGSGAPSLLGRRGLPIRYCLLTST